MSLSRETRFTNAATFGAHDCDPKTANSVPKTANSVPKTAKSVPKTANSMVEDRQQKPRFQPATPKTAKTANLQRSPPRSLGL